jgi:hypothetical protein
LLDAIFLDAIFLGGSGMKQNSRGSSVHVSKNRSAISSPEEIKHPAPRIAPARKTLD